MKVAVRSLLLAVMAYIFCMPGTTVGAADNVIKLKLATSYPVGHVSYIMGLNFKKRVEELGKGKVIVEYYPAEQLGKLKDLLRICGSGVSDISNVSPSFYAGQLPLGTVVAGPFFTTAVEGSAINQRMLLESPEIIAEYKKYGVRPIMGHVTCQYDVGTVKKKVTKPEDLKGLKIRTPGGFFDKIALRYGISPISIASPEIYEATQRGVCDGLLLSFASVKGYRVNELEKYHTYGLRMGAQPNTYIINEKKWQSLPNDVKDIVIQASKEASVWYGETWDKEQKALAELYEKEGMVITRISGEELKVWTKPIRGIEEDWLNDMEKRGLKSESRAVFDKFQKLCSEIVK